MKIFAGVLVAIFAISVLAIPAVASEANIQFIEKATGSEYGTQANPVQMCSGPLTVKDATLLVENQGPSTDTYAFSLQDMPAGWTGQIQPDLMLASGESKMLNLFYINNYYTEPGTYFFTIKAVSKTDASYVIQPKRVQVEILPCFTFSLEPQQQAGYACEEKVAPVNFSLILENSGKYAQTFDVSTSSDAAVPSMGSINLEPGQSAGLMVAVDVAALEGQQKITVSARSRAMQTARSADIMLDVRDCYLSEAAIEPSQSSGCVGKPAGFRLLIRNTGTERDTYSIDVPDWVEASASELTISPGGSGSVDLEAVPVSEGLQDVEVSILSTGEASPKKLSARLDASECRDIVVIASPASTMTCRGGIAAYDVTVKNRGVLEDKITLSASAGLLDENTVTLASGQSQTVQLNVDTSPMEPGSNTIEITASDGKVSDKSYVDVEVENCYASKIEIMPDNKSVCPFERFNYTIKLTNTGKQPDSYTVRFKDITENASLEPGQSASWDIPAYSEESGVYSLAAIAESVHGASNASAVLIVQQLGKCFAVDLAAAEKAPRATVNEARTANITVKNTGSTADEYVISAEGPSWAYVSPDKVSLEPGAQAEVYLYISPPAEADNSSVKIVVSAKSGHAAGSTAVVALVGNATLPESELAEGGFSLSNLTGAVIYEEGEMPLWKVAAIAIITIAIIIVLIVRFALLVKG